LGAALSVVAFAPAARANTTVVGEQTLPPKSANLDLLGQGNPIFPGVVRQDGIHR
jgi:hypothetical protein